MNKTESEKQELVELFAQSGLSLRQFCRDHGIAASTFYGWNRKAAPNQGEGQPTFIELELPPSAEPDLASPPAPAPELVIELPMGVVVRIRGLSL